MGWEATRRPEDRQNVRASNLAILPRHGHIKGDCALCEYHHYSSRSPWKVIFAFSWPFHSTIIITMAIGKFGVPVLLLLALLIGECIPTYFGGGSDEGGFKPPSLGVPYKGPKGSKSAESWFGGASSWFDKGKKGKEKEKAKELGVTPPPFSTPSPMPLVKLIEPIGPGPVLEAMPPSLLDIPKEECACDMMTNVVAKFGQFDVSTFVMNIKKMPEKPEPTLYDSCGEELKDKIKPLDSPPVKVMLQQVGQPDLVGLKACYDAVVVAQNVTTVKDLVLNLKQNSPGVYEILIQLILKLQINFDATLNLFGEASANLVTKFVALLKSESDVKVAVQKCMEEPDKGPLFDLLASIKQTYPTLAASISLDITGSITGGLDAGPPPLPPASDPKPKDKKPKKKKGKKDSAEPTTSPAPTTPFPSSSPAPPPLLGAGIGMPPCVEKILVDLKAKLEVEGEMKKLLGGLDLDCDANLTELMGKAKGNLPDLMAKIVAKLKPKDVDGLVVVIKGVISGSIASQDDLANQLKSQCPGVIQFLLALTAKFKLTVTAFFEKLTPPQTELIGKLQSTIVEYSAQINVMLQGTSQSLLDALKNAIPALKDLFDAKLSVKDATIKVSAIIMAQLKDPKVQQKVIDSLPPADPAKLEGTYESIKKNLPDLIKMLLSLLKPGDLDGLGELLSSAMSNKFSTVDEFSVQLKSSCPGFLNIWLWILARIKVFWNDFDDGMEASLKDLLKNIMNLLLELLKKLMELLKAADPDDLGKILDALGATVPPLVPICNAIKLQINIWIQIRINGGPGPGPSSPAPPPPPPPMIASSSPAPPPPPPPPSSSPAPPPPPPPPAPPSSSPAPPPPPPPPPPPTPVMVPPPPPSTAAPTTPKPTTLKPSTPIPPTTPVPCPPGGGAWGPWGDWSACTDTCGRCGTHSRTRQCPSAPACPCQGPDKEEEQCNPIPCSYPRNSCCKGTAKMGKHEGKSTVVCTV